MTSTKTQLPVSVFADYEDKVWPFTYDVILTVKDLHGKTPALLRVGFVPRSSTTTNDFGVWFRKHGRASATTKRT